MDERQQILISLNDFFVTLELESCRDSAIYVFKKIDINFILRNHRATSLREGAFDMRH